MRIIFRIAINNTILTYNYYLYYVHETVQHNMHRIIQLIKNIYKKDKCALFYIDNMMLSCTQHVNHVTYLVVINKLHDTTVTYIAHFPDSTS